MMKKIPTEAIAFQPDAQEIRNQRLPFPVWFCLWSIFLIVTVFVVAGLVIKRDVNIPAHGKLASADPKIVMKPLERAVIKQVHVRIGDTVKENQVLFSFDPTYYGAELQRLANEFEVRQAKVDRLKAEFDGTPFTLPENASEARRMQYALYKQRQAYYNERIEYFEGSIRQNDATRKSYEDSLVKQQEQLEATKNIEDMYIILEKESASSLKDLLQVSISRMEMESGVDQLKNSLIELSHQRETTIASRNSFIQEWRTQISTDLVNAEIELNETRRSRKQYEMMSSYVVLRAPCNAVVHEIANFPEGSAVDAAEALITLVPLDSKVQLEAELRPQDIGKVHVGSRARIKLDAFPFQKYGTLSGKVISISEDTLVRRGAPRDELETATYYWVVIELEGSLRNTPKDFRLIPGMEAHVEICTGQRRALEFVLYPFLKGLDGYNEHHYDLD